MTARSSRIGKAPLFLFFCGYACLLFVIFGRHLLPARFKYDAAKLQALAQGKISLENDMSYEHAAALYRFFGLEDAPFTTSLVGFTAAALVLVATLRVATVDEYSFGLLFLAGSYLVLAAVYLATYSKDVFALVVSVGLLASVRGERFRYWPLLCAMAAYGAYLRHYWLLVVAFSFAFWLFACWPSVVGRRLFVMFCGAQSILLGYSYIFPLVMGKSADYARVLVNAARMYSPDSESVIPSWFESVTPLGSFANIVLAEVALVFPYPLLLTGGSEHAVFAVLIAGIWVASLGGLRRIVSVPTHALPEPFWPTLSLLLAIVMVLALFEPDFGSFLRHLTPLLPILMILRINLDRSAALVNYSISNHDLDGPVRATN